MQPEELRRKLRTRRFGGEHATLILTRIAGEQSVVVASPHAAPRPEPSPTDAPPEDPRERDRP